MSVGIKKTRKETECGQEGLKMDKIEEWKYLIYVNPELSKKVQKLCFDNGIFWALERENKNKIQCIDLPYLLIAFGELWSVKPTPEDTQLITFDELKEKLKANSKAKHPLLNENSPHYKLFDKESIEQFEKLFTKDELMAWAKICYYKYMFRLGRKDEVKKELKKMATFEAYYDYLKDTK